ncbi:MAG: HAD-IC family P-type ATPase, partial [Ignavibacteria bacterium]|nr:HAD-IC family P-type ATPase [Ignavibacteria bacterium]
FDKTGTITEGRPVVTEFITLNGETNYLLKIIGAVESKSEHPIAKAIADFVKQNEPSSLSVEQFETLPGFGVKAKIDGKEILIGNEKLLLDNNIIVSFENKNHKEVIDEGKTVSYVSVNNILSAIIIIDDPIKNSSIEAIRKIKALGIRTVMLTGDNFNTAKKIADKIGIDEFFADVLPEQKADYVKKIQGDGQIAAMVGDGINDAPALAQADVSIALSSGTDVAMETADITIMKNDLNLVVKAIKLSKITIATIKQNLFWAFIYNVIGIPLAGFGILNPMISALAMAFSSVSVVSNSLRIRKRKI